MSRRVGNVAIIEPEPHAFCEACGKLDELRPYGPKGERICYDCAMKDEKSAKRQLIRRLLGLETH